MTCPAHQWDVNRLDDDPMQLFLIICLVFLVLVNFVEQESTSSNSDKVEATVKDEEDYLADNCDGGNDNEDCQVAEENKFAMYYETEVTAIKEEILDSEDLKKSVIEIKSIEVQIENITLSKNDLKRKYYDLKKVKNRTRYFCKNCGEKMGKLGFKNQSLILCK